MELNLIKQINVADVINWTLIEVPRANLYKWSIDAEFGNEVQYKEICDWCERLVPQDNWVSLISFDGRKQFYIKDPKYITMFMLRWGSVVDTA